MRRKPKTLLKTKYWQRKIKGVDILYGKAWWAEFEKQNLSPSCKKKCDRHPNCEECKEEKKRAKALRRKKYFKDYHKMRQSNDPEYVKRRRKTALNRWKKL